MTVYRILTPTNVYVVDATNSQAALSFLGERLGYKNKPWLWRDLPVREITDTELQQWQAAGRRVVRAQERRDPTKP